MDFGGDKRERILAAASRLIVRNGLQCSMSAIAEEAGVATGSLYNYFRNKEELVLGVYVRVSNEMAQSLVVPAGEGGSPADAVTLYIARYIDFIWADAERALLFDYLDNNPLLSFDDAKAVFGPLVQHGIGLIETAQASGAVRSGLPTLIMSFVRGSIRNSLKRLRQTGAGLAANDRELIAQMCWAAIRA